MSFKDMLKNDDAVSISLGFILILSITVIVFSAVVLSYYTLAQQSQKTATRESFNLLGSELALRMTTIDTLINITGSLDGGVNSLEYEFSIPPSLADNYYTVNITNTSKKIILESDNGAKAWVPYNTSANIEGKVLSSSQESYKMVYENGTIKIREQ